MKVKLIIESMQACGRFSDAVRNWRDSVLLNFSEEQRLRFTEEEWSSGPWSGKEQAAIRRASLDLTRILARMRNEL